MTGIVNKISDWLGQLPKLARRAVIVSFLGSLFLVIGWAQFFFLKDGTLVDFGTSAVAILISFLVILCAGGMGLVGGLIQLAFIPPRRAGLISICAGLIPLIIYMVIMFYLKTVKGIDFD